MFEPRVLPGCQFPFPPSLGQERRAANDTDPPFVSTRPPPFCTPAFEGAERKKRRKGWGPPPLPVSLGPCLSV